MGRKQPKTLSGIETKKVPIKVDLLKQAGNNLKPYQGLKLARTTERQKNSNRRKQPKTLSGIETLEYRFQKWQRKYGRKQPKTLSGIETLNLADCTLRIS